MFHSEVISRALSRQNEGRRPEPTRFDLLLIESVRFLARDFAYQHEVGVSQSFCPHLAYLTNPTVWQLDIVLDVVEALIDRDERELSHCHQRQRPRLPRNLGVAHDVILLAIVVAARNLHASGSLSGVH